MDACSLKLIGELMIQVSFFILVCIDHDARPKDFFTQGLCGGLQQRTSSTPLMEYLKDSLDTGQIEDGFFNFKSIKGHSKRGGLSLTLTNQGQTYSPECNPNWLHNETLVFVWGGSAHSTHNTAKVCDWSVSNLEQISLVKMFSFIS